MIRCQYITIISLCDLISSIDIPVAFGFFNEFECKLALSCTAKTMQHEDALTCALSLQIEVAAHPIENVLSTYKRGHRRRTQFTFSLPLSRFEWRTGRNLGCNESTFEFIEIILLTQLLDCKLRSRVPEDISQHRQLFLDLLLP